ncbi:MAG: sigma-E processing peptidase SpoIIGA [Solirubrobacterales bacterium]
MVVYIDMLLIENLIINCFLLEVTAKTLKVNLKLLPMLAAGILGSLYVLVLFYPKANLANTMAVKLIVAFLMIITAFRSRDKLFLIKACIVFIMFSMLLAGLCIFIQFSEGVDISGSIILNFTIKKLFVSLMIFFISINRIVIFIKNRKEISQLIYKIDIVANDKTKSIMGFLDTGNELCEPITNTPVILVNEDIYRCFYSKDYEKLYIPYRIFNGEKGTLEAFKADYINLYHEKKVIRVNAVIALSNGTLSPAGDYEALISRGILLGGRL